LTVRKHFKLQKVT